jgi:glycosyltransferase involved in cell wall biosynthesis
MNSVSDAENYVLIAQQEWALNLGSNARNLAAEISKKHRVMYVNPAMDIKSIYKQIGTKHGKERLRMALGLGQNTIKAGENLWVHTPATLNLSINWLRNRKLYNILNRRNARGFFKSIRRILERLNWAEEKTIVFNDSQMFNALYTKTYLAPLLSFYYIRDNLIEHPYFKYHGSVVEPQAIATMDAIFANSAYLADYGRHYNPRSLDIGQGCELDMYDADRNYPIPADIESIPHPRLGYIGFLTGERLDIQLLEDLADEKPEWSWVLIGPEEIMFQQSKLHSKPNVYFLGARKPDTLPTYIQHLDVCLNPQSVNALTVGNYPRKIDEYLAMGKPTVATDTPAMQMFLPHVHLAVGVPAYVQAIEQALQPVSAADRQAGIDCAKSHTWEACVDKIYATQAELLKEKNTTVSQTLVTT